MTACSDCSCQPSELPSPPVTPSTQSRTFCKLREVLACLHSLLGGINNTLLTQAAWALGGDTANAGVVASANCSAGPMNPDIMDKAASSTKTQLIVRRRGVFSHQGNADHCSLSLGCVACFSRSQRTSPTEFHTAGNTRPPLLHSTS